MSHTLAQDFATVRDRLADGSHAADPPLAALARIEQRMGELAAEVEQAQNFLGVSERERRLSGMREATLRARVERLEGALREIVAARYGAYVHEDFNALQERAAAILSEGESRKSPRAEGWDRYGTHDYPPERP